MYKSLLAGIMTALMVGVLMMSCVSVFDKETRYAQVLSVTPVKKTIDKCHRACRRLARQPLNAVRNKPVFLAIVPFSEVWRNSNNRLTNHNTAENTTPETVSDANCIILHEKEQKIMGYNVTYQIGEKRGNIHMATVPGKRIPLDRNGQLLLDSGLR